MVQQSDTYFERCQAADFNASVHMRDKRACWARWLRYYAASQPPDRKRHARERLDALASGEAVTPLPGMPDAVVGGTYAASFLPTVDDAHAVPLPIPSDASAAPVPAAAPVPPPAEPAPPHDGDPACAPVCDPAWHSCVEQCEDRPTACIDTCKHEHLTCMNGCF